MKGLQIINEYTVVNIMLFVNTFTNMTEHMHFRSYILSNFKLIYIETQVTSLTGEF